jgi:biotin carboxylase
MGKALLVLGGGPDQVFMIQTSREMGYITVCVDGDPSAPGLELADYSRAISFSDTDDVIMYCKNLIADGVNLSGVSTMGSDIPHIVSQVASFFNWIGPTAQTGQWASHKFKMKTRFVEENIAIPRFGLVRSAQHIDDLRKTWGVDTVIIKPTDRAGSRGVRVIYQNDDLNLALDYARKFSFNNEILLEEFITGPQISTETVMYKSTGVTPGFADRVYDDTAAFSPAVMENGGWLPSDVSPELRQDVCLLVEAAARALGIDNGVAKGDVVICPTRGPLIIEMAARLSGGDFSESLVPLSSGINYVRTAIDIALGSENVDISLLTPQSMAYVANRYFFVRPGILEDIFGLDTFLNMPEICKLDLNYEVGSRLPIIDSHAKRTGVFVLKAKTKALAQALICDVYKTVKFKVDGVWVSGDPKEYSCD